MTQNVLDFIQHLSDQPWSNYTAADYSIEQWHSACLIHQHDGPPTSKDQCKLPVKTPSGTVNRNGVHAAAAALAGARGGVHASSEEKDKAAAALVRYYHQMDEEPPPSLLKHDDVENFIEHFGIKGMRWGVRRSRVKTSSDFRKTAPLRRRKPKQLTNKQLRDVNARLNLEQNFRRMNPSTVQKGHSAAKNIIALSGTAVALASLAQTPWGRAGLSFIKGRLKSIPKRVAKSPQLVLPGI